MILCPPDRARLTADAVRAAVQVQCGTGLVEAAKLVLDVAREPRAVVGVLADGEAGDRVAVVQNAADEVALAHSGNEAFLSQHYIQFIMLLMGLYS